MDSDVEVCRNLDKFLVCGAFSGYESSLKIPTGIMGAAKGNKWIEYLLSYYENRDFVKPDGSYDLTTNVLTITEMTQAKYHFRPDTYYQVLDNEVYLFPPDWFCPIDYYKGVINITENTHAIHHFNGSWLDPKQRVVQQVTGINIELREKLRNTKMDSLTQKKVLHDILLEHIMQDINDNDYETALLLCDKGIEFMASPQVLNLKVFLLFATFKHTEAKKYISLLKKHNAVESITADIENYYIKKDRLTKLIQSQKISEAKVLLSELRKEAPEDPELKILIEN